MEKIGFKKLKTKLELMFSIEDLLTLDIMNKLNPLPIFHIKIIQKWSAGSSNFYKDDFIWREKND